MSDKYCTDCGHVLPDSTADKCPRCYEQWVGFKDMNADEKIEQLRAELAAKDAEIERLKAKLEMATREKEKYQEESEGAEQRR